MGIIFLILSFIFIFNIFFVSYQKREDVFTNFRLAFVKSSLIVSALAVIFTEILSFFRILTPAYVIMLWLVVSIIGLVTLIFLVKKNNYSFKNINFDKIIVFLKNESTTIKLIIFLILIIFLALFCIAFTINNNWDSYTYHLPRVEHWIQDKNVDFFPTNNIRQLYLAPFDEYFILNLKLLSESVLFINFVQFFSMINCLLLASLIAKSFGLSKRGQFISLILALTLPMGLLQSTTTQTDLVVSFFLLSFVYFSISIAKKKILRIENLIFLSLGLSLGILTKATFYIFAFPFCLLFGIYYIKLFKLKSFLILFSVILAFLLLNFQFLNRNYVQFGSPMGPQKSSPFYLPNLNEKLGVKETLSNSAKNIGLHLATTNIFWNNKIDQVVTKFHDFIKFPLNSNKTSWHGMEYKTNFIIHHDITGNFFHIIILFISLVVIFIKFKTVPGLVKAYLFLIIFGFLFFAFLLKWQPWQTRLDLPMFFLIAPFSAYALSLIKQRKIAHIVCIFLLFTSIAMLFIYNPTKPILGKNSIFLTDNSSYIFDYNTAIKIESELEKNHISDVGLILDGDSWEWQYWLLSKNRRFEYILFNHDLEKTPNFDKNFKYRAIITTNDLWNPQINEAAQEILNIDEKTTLVIYKEERNTIITQ